MSSFPGPVIDVLSEDSYNAEHLPGAVNLCVYETAFLDKVKEQYPDLDTPLTVYGCGDDTQEAALAVSKLKDAGYRNVESLPGGLTAWKSGGGKVETVGATKPGRDGRMEVDPEASFIHWTGRNLFNFHHGELKLAGGFVELADGKPVAGEFQVDMASLSCTDLADSALNRMLIDHLRSADFFLADEHPFAVFRLVSAEEIPGATNGSPNYRFKGELTLRGATKPLEFDASVAQKEDRSHVAQAMLDLDRTLWGSQYGSGKFFARLGQHVVNDLVHLHLKVVTKA